MSRYLILLPAPEAEWADLPPEEHEKGHARPTCSSTRTSRAGGHTIVTGRPARAAPTAADVDAARRRRAGRS